MPIKIDQPWQFVPPRSSRLAERNRKRALCWRWLAWMMRPERCEKIVPEQQEDDALQR
jgi:hypothetical protein